MKHVEGPDFDKFQTRNGTRIVADHYGDRTVVCVVLCGRGYESKDLLTVTGEDFRSRSVTQARSIATALEKLKVTYP